MVTCVLPQGEEEMNKQWPLECARHVQILVHGLGLASRHLSEDRRNFCATFSTASYAIA